MRERSPFDLTTAHDLGYRSLPEHRLSTLYQLGAVSALYGGRLEIDASRLITHTGDSRVWLTFDDGPTPHITDWILEILDRENVKSVFFVCGAYAQRYPDLIRQTATRGHVVGNHSWSHACLPELDENEIRQELVRTQEVLLEIAGLRCNLFRPPWGALNRTVLEIAREVGLSPILWTISSGDWARPGAGKIAQRVVAQARAGSIVLFHDGCGDDLRPWNARMKWSSDRTQTLVALVEIIKRLRRSGFALPRLRELT